MPDIVIVCGEECSRGRKCCFDHENDNPSNVTNLLRAPDRHRRCTANFRNPWMLCNTLTIQSIIEAGMKLGFMCEKEQKKNA